jgi:Ca-activated chloride channel family protein
MRCKPFVCKSLRISLLAILCFPAAGQILSIPTAGGGKFGSAIALDAIQSAQMDFNYFTINSQNSDLSPLQTPSGSISKFDLKAPGKARREFTKGYQLLQQKDQQGAVEHLKLAIADYPNFVAAHNTLGTAYLNLGKNQEARDEFASAVKIDDHLPNSYLNLGCAQLALKEYPAAEEAFRKASSIAPLDLQLQVALAYGEFENKDYPAVISTEREVHARKHPSAALVHFFAAAAWEAQNNLTSAQDELRVLLKEDPKSASGGQFKQILDTLKQEERRRAQGFNAIEKVSYSIGVPTGPSPEIAGRMAQLAFQDMEEKEQIEEADVEPEAICHECAPPAGSELDNARSDIARRFGGAVFRSSVDEVNILFAATDHGKSVTNLTSADIGLRDNGQSPNAILNFRNESQLPLRLGLVIDTSNSVMDRFKFEQAAAVKFLEKVVTDANDLAFVVAVNNSVLMVQDFTSDREQTAHAINELAPGGGTALWDAVNYATEKLANRAETQPVARVLVVISDGEDNSSSATLKEVIATALRSEVAIYTVSTRDVTNEEESAVLGDRALQTISDLTGGASYVPGAVSHLSRSLSQLQEVIRSRYLISYRPAGFRRDGHYRPINISAEKDGHKLRVYARRGYYASATRPADRASGVNQ